MDPSQIPSTALAFMIAWTASRPIRAEEAGRVASACDELKRRGEFDAMMATLPPDIAGRLQMLYHADRGAVLARFRAVRPGAEQTRPLSGNSST